MRVVFGPNTTAAPFQSDFSWGKKAHILQLEECGRATVALTFNVQLVKLMNSGFEAITLLR